jgi:large subunit ribosomal protein L3
MDGLIGRKQGMTQVYDAAGHHVAVTVLEVGPCVVIQRKTKAREGYDAVQVGFGDQKESRRDRPTTARFKKAGATPKRVLREFRVAEGEGLKAGDTVDVGILDGAKYVDVTGITKGRGFQGVVRRHRMSGGPMTHGGHSKRRIGAVGMRASPGRVLRGHRLPGHMGHVKVTQQNLKVVELRKEQNLLLVSGAVPGPNGAYVVVKKALKKR